jgi:hypothetical protein
MVISSGKRDKTGEQKRIPKLLPWYFYSPAMGRVVSIGAGIFAVGPE